MTPHAVPPLASAQELRAAADSLRAAPPDVILAWTLQRFGASVVLSSSFGPEDMVLIHLASQHAKGLRVFTLDTGRLHPETYELMEAARNRFGLLLETYFPEHTAVERLEREQGYFSFRQSIEARKECCGIRKVEPLRRALAGRAAWITGVRREQSPTRTAVEVVELDAANGGIAKINPLASWTTQQVWAYLREHGVPYNALHDRGYPSIGCAPCTRAVKHHEDERSGRWWWESADQRECGLHVRSGGAR